MAEQVRLEYDRGGRGLPRVGLGAFLLSASFLGSSVVVLVVSPGGGHVWLFRVAVAVWEGLGIVAAVAMVRAQRRIRVGAGRGDGVTKVAGVMGAISLLVGLAGALGPDLEHRAPANRVMCAANMRQIGMAIGQYAKENGGDYPDRLGALFTIRGVGAKMFVCPGTEAEPARGPTTRAVADALTAGGHLSYVYVGAGLRNDCGRDTVVLFEAVGNHDGGGINVLFGDGRVVPMNKAEAREIVDRTAAGGRPVVWKGPVVRPTTRRVGG